MQEKDLFLPIKNYFGQYGYVCDGEVGGIDLYMEKGEVSVVVELKLSLDFKSLQQAALRQKIADTVYIGIARPKDMFSHAFKDKLYLLKRLGIGLIVVSPKTKAVEIVSEPVVSELSVYQQRNKNKKKALAMEFQKRKVKNNIGGVNKTKLITGYREEALLVLDALVGLGGQATTRSIREKSGIAKTTTILYNNYYGWFYNKKKGTYGVTETGLVALKEYRDTIEKLKEKNSEICVKNEDTDKVRKMKSENKK